MPIMLISSQKGGVGKSTLAVNLAVQMQAAYGESICIVDADTQSTASRFCADRIDSKFPPIQCLALYGNIAAQVKDLAKHYELIIIDTAGRDNPEMRSAAIVADLMLIPTKASQADLDTFEKLSEIVEQARILNPDLCTRVVLNMAPTNVKINEVAQARDYLAAYPEFIVCKSKISDRKSFRDALSEGAGMNEWNDAKGENEIEALVIELMGNALNV